jgi:hypothetical protein
MIWVGKACVDGKSICEVWEGSFDILIPPVSYQPRPEFVFVLRTFFRSRFSKVHGCEGVRCDKWERNFGFLMPSVSYQPDLQPLLALPAHFTSKLSELH